MIFYFPITFPPFSHDFITFYPSFSLPGHRAPGSPPIRPSHPGRAAKARTSSPSIVRHQTVREIEHMRVYIYI